MKNIDVFCGITSLGMPFPRENKNHIGYYDIIVDTLKKQGYNVSGFNFSRLDKNHTWDLNDNLNEDKSLAYIKNLRIKSIENLRKVNKLFKLIIPKKYQDSIKLEKEDFKITLKSMYMNSENPIFLYSGGVNDFFSYIKAGPVELLSREVRNNLPKDLKPTLEQCIKNIEDNWKLLYELNPNVKIYNLSFYYSPLYDKIQKVIYIQEKLKNKDKKYVNKFLEIINLYNEMLKELSEKYDFVEYVDLTFLKDYCAPMDFHPNTVGNEMIANKVLKKLELQNIIEQPKKI